MTTKKCAGCDSNVPTPGPALCPDCDVREAMIHGSAVEGLEQLEHWLVLEASFVAWCDERGLPNPHDD